MDEQLVLKNRLKVARAERGLSQGDLAKLCLLYTSDAADEL